MLKILIYSLLLALLLVPAGISVVAQPPVCDPEPVLRVVATDMNGDPVEVFPPTYITISGNGRYVAYESDNANIVPDDNNGVSDIFVYDRLDCSTRRVSVSTGGVEGNGNSHPGKFSDDGRYLLLHSYSTNFHPSYTDNSQTPGLFLLDLQTQTYQYLGLNATMPGDMSADGRYVVFMTLDTIDPGDTDGRDDLYLFDRDTEVYQQISDDTNYIAYNTYYLPGISSDGAYIAFSTDVSGLSFEDTNEFHDIFIYERATGNLDLISTSPQGLIGDDGSTDWPTLSADGRYIFFQSWAGNLVAGDTEETNDVFMYDQVTEEITCISVNEIGECGRDGLVHNYKSSVSADGRYILYHKDYFSSLYGSADAFLIYDRVADETKRISVTEAGQPIDVDSLATFTKTQYLSDDGRWAIFRDADGMLYLTDWQQLPYLPAKASVVNSVLSSTYDGIQSGESISVAVTSVQVNFTESMQNPAGNNSPNDITNPANYRLIRSNGSGAITQETCDPVSPANRVTVDSITYVPALKQAQVNFPDVLVNDSYRLVVCNLMDVHDNPLDGNADAVGGDNFILDFRVNVPVTLSPPVIQYPGINNIDDRRPEFAWFAGGGAARYEIQIDRVNPPLSTPIVVNGNTYIPPNDLPLGLNSWRVRSVGRNGDRSAWSETITFLILDGRLDAAPIRHSSASPFTPKLTWSGVDWATAYQIQIADDANFSSPDFTTEVESDVLEITLLEDDLLHGVYYWRVRAQRENGSWGEWSAADEFAYRVYEWDLE